ncbi:MAG: hypothetical protein WC856_23640 [Methylococcaceae bacterium]|jgi:hypothetical protein
MWKKTTKPSVSSSGPREVETRENLSFTVISRRFEGLTKQDEFASRNYLVSDITYADDYIISYTLNCPG